MKKIILILLLLAVIISGFYYLDNKDYEVDDIVFVSNIRADETIIDSNELINYLPIISKRNEITDHTYDFSNGFDLIFNINSDKIYKVRLIHDFQNESIHFINDAKEVYTLSQEDSLFFFKNESFKEIYKRYDPNFVLSNDNIKLQPSNDDFLINYSFSEQDSLEYNWTKKNKSTQNVLTNPNDLNVETTNSTTELLVYKNNKLIHEQNDFSRGIFVPEYDGNFVYQFQVKSNHQKEAKITKTMRYNISINRKPIFQLSHEQIDQGDFLKITGKYTSVDEIQSIESLIIGDIKFYKNQHDVIAYIPIHARTKPDTYAINIKTNGKHNFSYSVDITNRDFRTQYLYVSASTMASTSNSQAYDEYNNYFYPVRKISSETQYYDDEFVMPLKARISTEFGEGRYINDRSTSYSHSGLDLAAPKGTEVHAINHGVVTLSRHFALTGNTIIIDHGQGLLSYYLHLDTLNVNLNDKVTTGDIIGTVGSTGRSTGPHLHFGTSFYTTYIEPGYLIYGKPITKDNYKILFQ